MNGWANNIIDPEQKKSETSAPGDNAKSSAYLSQVERESGVWKPLKEAFPWNPLHLSHLRMLKLLTILCQGEQLMACQLMTRRP